MSAEAKTRIRYEHPVSGGLDPFDITVAEPQWFINASGYSRATTDPNALFDWPAIVQAIPFGYKTLIFCQKRAVIRAGEVIRAWDEADLRPGTLFPNDSAGHDGYAIFAQRLTLPYRGRFVAGDWSPLNVPIPPWAWATRLDDHALGLSRGLDDTLLVARIVYARSWHESSDYPEMTSESR